MIKQFIYRSHHIESFFITYLYEILVEKRYSRSFSNREREKQQLLICAKLFQVENAHGRNRTKPGYDYLP